MMKKYNIFSFSFFILMVPVLNGTKVENALIYHTVSSKAALDSVKKHGLYSSVGHFCRPFKLLQYNKAQSLNFSYMRFAKWYLGFWAYYAYQKINKNSFGDQWDVIYFKPEEPDVQNMANFAIQVDPNKTYVHNLNYRGGIDCYSMDDNRRNVELYHKSKVLLTDYTNYLQEANGMVLARPDLEVQLNPQTARPFYLHPDILEKGPYYEGEVIIPSDHISPNNLISIQDSIGRWHDIKPVKNIKKWLR